MARHRWDPPGRWNGSKDVKTCQKCGVQAHKTGMYSGFMLREPIDAERIVSALVDEGVLLEGFTKWEYHERMPACMEEK